ncbi:hypothetical protein [Janthinobacterium sp. GW460W]|nr:hypothetical protein [Janthinobacterium sp. GW460W]
MSATIRLTMAQALVRYLSVLRTEEGEPVFGGQRTRNRLERAA